MCGHVMVTIAHTVPYSVVSHVIMGFYSVVTFLLLLSSVVLCPCSDVFWSVVLCSVVLLFRVCGIS